MKKFIAIILSLITLLTLCACKEKQGLEVYVSELRSNVYIGSSELFTVKGGYGFKETPYQNDGKVGSIGYFLTLKLMDSELSQTTYTATLDFNGKNYSQTFKFSPISHSLIAVIEIPDFNLNEFEFTLSSGDKIETIKMVSELPNETISYKQALAFLAQSQPELIKAFSDSEGNFTAEIYARIIVKNDKAYWYIGLAGGNERLKALLVDGTTGKVLAIREII